MADDDLVPIGPGKPQAAASVTDDLASVDARDKPSVGEALWQGLLHGGGNIVTGARQLGARIPGMPSITGETPQGADQAAQQRAREYRGDFAPGPEQRMTPARAHPTAAGIGEMGGEMAMTAPMALATGGAGIPARIVMGALQGAAGAALNPVVSGRDFWSEKAKQGGAGAAVGGALGAAAGVMAPALGGDAQALARRGVGLTPGQRFGAQGAERSLQAFPIARGFIEGQVGRGVEDFDRAAVRQALEPIGAVLPRSVKAGHDMMGFMERSISDAYDTLLPRLGPIDRPQVEAAIINNPALRQLRSELPDDAAKRLDTMIDNRVLSRFDPATGQMDGTVFKRVESDVGKRATSLHGTNDSEIGDALTMVNAALRDSLAQANPQFAQYLQNINHSWAMSVRLKQAASRRADSESVFTPADMLNAIRRGDASRNHASFAKGDAMMQDFATQAQRVMGKSVKPYEDISAGSAIAGMLPGAALAGTGYALDLAQRHPALGQALRGSAGPFGADAGEAVSAPPRRLPRHSIGGP